MASQVLSGTSNPTYTNNTGQNVRVVINYMRGVGFGSPGTPNRFGLLVGGTLCTLNINWAGVGIDSSTNNGIIVVGRNLSTSSGNNGTAAGLPTEIMLAPGETFSAVSQQYNIVVIPEAG